MNRDVVLDMINHFNKDTVTFSSYNARSRKLPIYCHNALCMAKSGHILQLDLEKTEGKKKRKRIC